MDVVVDLRSVLSDESLADHFGGPTLSRAWGYTSLDTMEDIEIVESGPDGLEVLAHVWGMSSAPYRVVLSIGELGSRSWLRSRCTCPVGVWCKHGAAVALVLRDAIGTEVPGAAPTTATWERELTGVISDLETLRGATRGSRRLALQFDLRPPDPRRAAYQGHDPQLTVRPLQQGAKQNWIKTGATWSDIPSALLKREHDRDQIEALSALHTTLSTVRTYWGFTESAQLHEFGPELWRLLRAARDAGVTFVATGGLVALEVLDDDLEISADLVAVGEAESTGTELRLTIEHAGEQWAGERVLPIGQPAHGVALLGDDQRAFVAALARSAPVSTTRLLRSEERLQVPEADRLSFETSYLPVLGKHLTLRSSDGSVAIPEPVAPRLRLTVTWHSSTKAELQWSWHYGADETAPSCLVTSADRLSGLRDPVAEDTLVAQLVTSGALEGWVATTTRPVRLDTLAVNGQDTLRLADELLPSVRATGLVEVVEAEPPDFREAQGDVDVRFETVPTPASAAGPTDWLDLMVVLMVEGEQVPLPEVLSALTLGYDRIILPSGLYVAADRPEFRALHDLVVAAAELAEQKRDELRVSTHDLGLLAQVGDLGGVPDEADEWVARARALRDLTELPAPDTTGVVSTLRSYQLDGFRWLAFLWQNGLGGVLADDMGLGKTVQVLALVSHARAQGAGPFLVVAPTSVVSAWQTQAARHTPGLRVRAITSSSARRGVSVADLTADADIVVTTYTLLRLGIEEFAEHPWGGVILDEAQQVKNHRGKTYQAVRRLESPFRLAVTGTPFENRLMELWALLSITAPGLYPRSDAFTKNVVVPVEKEGDADAMRRFRHRIRPFLLRRTKELVAADLPPKQEQVLEVQLGAKHRKVYDTHLQKERQKILGLVDDFDRNRVAIFSSLTKLRQLALDAALVDPAHEALGSAKLDVLADQLLEVTAEGHRALVFSQFTTFLRRVRDRLDAEGIATVYLDGTTRHRGAVVEEFTEGTTPVFLISLKAGGVGLTLTEADYVYVLDPWWNPATEAQAVDRAHRIGQERPVMVYRLVSADTIEEKVMELKARKAELFSQVLDGDGVMGTTIGADDIRALFDD